MRDFEMTTGLRVGNRIVTPLVRLGLPMGRLCLLTVAGRRSGLPRTTPVAVTKDGDGWILVAAYGRVDWVRNLLAAGEATIELRGRRIDVHSEVLPDTEAAEVLRRLFNGADPVTLRMIGPYFRARPDSGVDDWIDESRDHPVFRLVPADA